ncbi:MAG: hypothetical protein ACR2OU_04240 [Thermomicrobiales bacterium]
MTRPKDPVAYLSEVLSSRVRAQVLPYLIARVGEAFSLTQIARGIGLSVSSVQHECYKLERLGILHGRPLQGSRRYALNRTSAPANALIAFVIATFEPCDLLAMALSDLTEEGLQIAALAGQIPPTQDSPYLILVGDLSLDQLGIAQERVSSLLDLPADALQVAFFQPDQWLRHVESGNDFVVRVRSLPQIPIVGSVDLTQKK